MSRPAVHPGRREAFLAADFQERTAIHHTVAAMKAEALEARRALGRRYLERHGERCVIPRETAFARLDLPAQETAPARGEAMTLADGRGAQANNRALEFPVLGRDFPADGAVLRLATSPCLLAPIVRYFDMLPVLFNVFVSRAHTTELLPNSAHHFHLDPEDVLTHKVFVHLTDVDDDCGPLHVLPADTTQTVLKAVDYRAIDRVTDEQVSDLVGWESVVAFCAPTGTIVFADTSRCLHFGGRPRRAGKPVRYHLVCQYLLPTSFLFPIRGDAEDPRHLPTLEPSGDEEWDALIGACHI